MATSPAAPKAAPSIGQVVTIIGGGVVAVLPVISGLVPSPYSDIASGLLAALVAAWHLYQPSPSA